jgi:hypothetical protein
VIRTLWASIMGNPKLMKKLHYWLALGWLCASPVIMVWFKNSLPLLVFMSAYAIVTGHWSAAQAATVEVKQDDAQEGYNGHTAGTG